jgi:hypothetical protein
LGHQGPHQVQEWCYHLTTSCVYDYRLKNVYEDDVSATEETKGRNEMDKPKTKDPNCQVDEYVSTTTLMSKTSEYQQLGVKVSITMHS